MPQRPESGEPLFRYIWRRSRSEQVRVLAIVLASIPFYYASLDVPKLIVNDAIQGRAFASSETVTVFRLQAPWSGAVLFEGVQFDRTTYLFALCAIFLALVLVNGAFKYAVNMRKGALGERVLQTLRFELFRAMVTAKPDQNRRLAASEAATIIKDEVEPIGGFVGDAFIQPLFLGGQAATALAFIVVQSVPLGLCAGALVAAQALIIPRLRREQLRLSKMRQLQSRSLAGRIGEVVDGLDEVRNHGAAAYEMSRVEARLEDLYRIRFQLYGRKFLAKFANNLLAQVTPFLFYAIGGYFALRGDLAIGQLVAVIAAYRDLPPPVKELIDWDQQRLDVEVKFQQVMEQFPPRPVGNGLADEPDLSRCMLSASGLGAGQGGSGRGEKVRFEAPSGAHVVLVGPQEAASSLARALSGRAAPGSGRVFLNGRPLDQIPAERLGRTLAYAGPDAAVFEGSFRDNLLYGLRRQPAEPNGEDPWLDLASAGLSDAAQLETALLQVLRTVELEGDLLHEGLSAKIDADRRAELAQRIVAARAAMEEALKAHEASGLVERFDRARYGAHLSIRENLLFTPLPGGDLEPDLLRLLRDVVQERGLEADLERVGTGFAATLVEIFADPGSGRGLVERFGFTTQERLDRFRRALDRRAAGRPASGDVHDFVRLALRYRETRHRLGLLDAALEQRILEARPAAAEFARQRGRDLRTYDAGAYAAGASIRENLLFGRVISEAPSAGERLAAALSETLAATGLDRHVLTVGLEQPAGRGRTLFPAQRAAMSLARCLLKRPSVLVVDGLLPSLGDARGARVLRAVREAMRGRTLVVTMGEDDHALAAGFDLIVELGGGRPRIRSAAGAPPSASPEPAVPDSLGEMVRALRCAPALASLETARLKLLAFTGERVAFSPGDVLMREGDEAHDALVILSGQAAISIDEGACSLRLGLTEPHAIVGEMGALTSSRRSATVTALTPMWALRIRRDVLSELVLEYPEFGLTLLQAQIARTAELETLLIEARRSPLRPISAPHRGGAHSLAKGGERSLNGAQPSGQGT